MRHILFRVAKEIGFATTTGRHREQVAALSSRLDGENPPDIVIAHTGFGLHERLPAKHVYRQFTFLREPVERTVSSFYYARDVMGHLDADMTLNEFLEEDSFRAFNLQTAFLGGLTIGRHLDGMELCRRDYDASVLDRAKAALEQQEVVGFTEEFDRSLEALRMNFGWPLRKTLYVSVNRGRRPNIITAPERKAVREANELDCDLYAYARERSSLPGRSRAFTRANRLYGRVHPLARRVRAIARN
jgi:hypothetical protein